MLDLFSDLLVELKFCAESLPYLESYMLIEKNRDLSIHINRFTIVLIL
jgi:hypothetical protein